MYPALDFQHYYDKPYFTNDNFNEFGPSDEELFRVGVDKRWRINSKTSLPMPITSRYPTIRHIM